MMRSKKGGRVIAMQTMPDFSSYRSMNKLANKDVVLTDTREWNHTLGTMVCITEKTEEDAITERKPRLAFP